MSGLNILWRKVIVKSISCVDIAIENEKKLKIYTKIYSLWPVNMSWSWFMGVGLFCKFEVTIKNMHLLLINGAVDVIIIFSWQWVIICELALSTSSFICRESGRGGAPISFFRYIYYIWNNKKVFRPHPIPLSGMS